MLVRNVLQSKPRKLITIAPEATVKEALGLFVEHNIGSLPVVDSEGRLLGIFTERDVLFKVHEDPQQFARRTMSEVMTRQPMTCECDDVVHDVMGVLSRHRVGQLPVLENTRLVGVVSVGDLIKALFEQVEAENRHLLSYIYGQA